MSKACRLEGEGARYLPQGALTQKIKFQTFTNEAFMEEVEPPPHNNTNAPGHAHTGSLGSLPPFHRTQTQSHRQPRAPTAYLGKMWGLTGYQVETKQKHTHIQPTKEKF